MHPSSCRVFISAWVLLTIVAVTQIHLCHAFSDMKCMDSERQALTTFRKALNDSRNRLSSWDNSDGYCCKWIGITCDNETRYVVKLNLGGMDLSGQIHHELIQLKHLQFLDLSHNSFFYISIPEFLGSMKQLRYLHLSTTGFVGSIPQQLGNLSNLISLDLSTNDDLHTNRTSTGNTLTADNLLWLANKPALKYLNMGLVDLSMASRDWVHLMNMLPSLVELRLPLCRLSYISPALSFVNFTSLRVLDLGWNKFNSSIPSWISNISSLVFVDLTHNMLHGLIPHQFAALPSLEELFLGDGNDNLSANCSELLKGSWSKLKRLDLNSILVYGEIPTSIGNITSLVELTLQFNRSTGSIPRSITNLVNLKSLSLSGYYTHGPLPNRLDGLKNLEYLWLKDCKITGPIPETIGELFSLQSLRLSPNLFNGTLPTTLGQLSNLYQLDVSSNSLTGNVSQIHFENLRSLELLDLSSNSLVFDINSNWVPPFQLQTAFLGSCHMGPSFPHWLQTQIQITGLHLSNTSLSGPVPAWFWNLVKGLLFLVLSNNKISGKLPNPLKMQPFASVDLSNNLFEGPIPHMLHEVRLLDLSNNQFHGPIPPVAPGMDDLFFFSVSNNQINGTIPSFIGDMISLTVLDLSRNNISGTIPSRLGDCAELLALDLSWNHLSGGIPTSLGQLNKLQTLHLSNNSLSGKIPSSLKSYTSLETLDLGENNFSGYIPSWIDESFTALRIISLRSNKFTGKIPPQVLHIKSLQVLDAAQNCLSGSIPQNFKNLTAMRNKEKNNRVLSYGFGSYYEESLLLSTKGSLLEFTRTLSLVTCIDLSSNNLSGPIPEELTSLVGLHVLNLSRNHLDGNIADSFSMMTSLESFDLSWNRLSGKIPSSISDLTFLSRMNLSYNNLSGRIPSGNQLQALDDPTSIYIGNPGLCGPPVTETCADDETTDQGPMPGDGGEEFEVRLFPLSVELGFISGFWGFCCILLFKESWRMAYFRFFDEMQDKFFLVVAMAVRALN